MAEDASIYVPPGEARSPEKQPRGKLGRWVIVAIAVGTVATFGSLVWLALLDGPTAGSEGAPMASRLRETSFVPSADRLTGYRRLASALRPPIQIDGVAVGAGTLALGVRSGGRGTTTVMRVHDGEVSTYTFDAEQAITALAIDPEGSTYVGFRRGTFARISPTGVVNVESPLSDGTSVVGFAFAPSRRQGAVMLSGGEVRVGERPLRTGALSALTMPERARTREMIYDGGDTLWVAGDAGAVFERGSEAFEERNLPTPGRVTALGLDTDGEVIAGQAGGQIYRSRGTGWTLLGQVGATPIGIATRPGGEVTVACASGALYGLAEGGQDFYELPDYHAPSGALAVHHASFFGPTVAMATNERALVFDDALWDSSADDVARPAGAEGRVVPIGPGSLGDARVPPPLFVVDGVEIGRYRRFEGAGLVPAPQVSYAGAEIDADALYAALVAVAEHRRMWIGGALYTADALGLRRWTGRGVELELVSGLPEGAGELLAASAREEDGAVEVWAIGSSGALFRASDADGAPFEEIVSHDRFVALYGETFRAYSVGVTALARGRALVTHNEQLLALVDAHVDADVDAHAAADAGAREVRAVPLDPPRPFAGVLRVGDRVLVLRDDAVIEVDADGAPHRWTLPEGWTPGAYGRDGSLVVAVDGDDVVMGVREDRRDGIARCRAGRCALIPLPEEVTPARVFFTPDHRVLVWENQGVLGVIEPRGG